MHTLIDSQIYNETDVIVYSGAIDMHGYTAFCDTIPKDRKKKLLLVLSTFGGDPHAGYRIARASAHYYGNENFSILIPWFCKSAGTLICIGAHKLIMMDQSELGPLDVQVQKNDEIFQQNSGLDIIRGMFYLQNDALESFKRFLFDLNGRSRLSTRTAAKISGKLVNGLYRPLVEQIDPLKLGEMNAALQIASHYGQRLDEKAKSLKQDALSILIHNYPSHGCVIDRSEARELFNNVEKAGIEEEKLGRQVYLEWAAGDYRSKHIYKLTGKDHAKQPIIDGENKDANENSTTDDGRATEAS